jgi:hypothetical protein
MLDDMSLGSDGVSGNDINVGKPHRLSKGKGNLKSDSLGHLLSLVQHGNGFSGTFDTADGAPFAVLQVRDEVTFLVLVYAAFRAIKKAQTALGALGLVNQGMSGFPVAGLVFNSATRLSNAGAQIQFLPGDILSLSH